MKRLMNLVITVLDVLKTTQICSPSQKNDASNVVNQTSESDVSNSITTDVDAVSKLDFPPTNPTNIPPSDWAWKGYTTWYLHGMMAPKSKRLLLFESGKYNVLYKFQTCIQF